MFASFLIWWHSKVEKYCRLVLSSPGPATWSVSVNIHPSHYLCWLFLVQAVQSDLGWTLPPVCTDWSLSWPRRRSWQYTENSACGTGTSGCCTLSPRSVTEITRTLWRMKVNKNGEELCCCWLSQNSLIMAWLGAAMLSFIPKTWYNHRLSAHFRLLTLQYNPADIRLGLAVRRSPQSQPHWHWNIPGSTLSVGSQSSLLACSVPLCLHLTSGDTVWVGRDQSSEGMSHDNEVEEMFGDVIEFLRGFWSHSEHGFVRQIFLQILGIVLKLQEGRLPRSRGHWTGVSII